MSPADGQAHQGQLFLNMLRRGALPFGCAPRLFCPAVRRPAARQPAPRKSAAAPKTGAAAQTVFVLPCGGRGNPRGARRAAQLSGGRAGSSTSDGSKKYLLTRSGYLSIVMPSRLRRPWIMLVSWKRVGILESTGQ